MKRLVMCEGPNEKAVVEMLLDAGRMEFSRDDLVGFTPVNLLPRLSKLP